MPGVVVGGGEDDGPWGPKDHFVQAHWCSHLQCPCLAELACLPLVMGCSLTPGGGGRGPLVGNSEIGISRECPLHPPGPLLSGMVLREKGLVEDRYSIPGPS
jgi:hypothetical protein